MRPYKISIEFWCHNIGTITTTSIPDHLAEMIEKQNERECSACMAL